MYLDENDLKQRHDLNQKEADRLFNNFDMHVEQIVAEEKQKPKVPTNETNIENKPSLN